MLTRFDLQRADEQAETLFVNRGVAFQGYSPEFCVAVIDRLQARLAQLRDQLQAEAVAEAIGMLVPENKSSS